MFPVGKAKGQIWHHDEYRCDVEYDISAPLRRTSTLRVQRIVLTVADDHRLTLLNSYGLTLMLEDGSRHSIPQALQSTGLGHLEFYVESQR